MYLRTSKEGSTGKPGMLQSMELHRVRLYLAREQEGAQFDYKEVTKGEEGKR